MCDLKNLWFLQPCGMIVLATVIAIEDYRNYRISNRSVLATLLAGLLLLAYKHQFEGLIAGLSGAIVGFTLLIPFYALGGLTAGDVKWLSALGAWYGPKGIVGLFLISSLALGILSLLWILKRRRVAPPLMLEQSTKDSPSYRIDAMYASDARRTHLIPYALTVAIGVIVIESIQISRL